MDERAENGWTATPAGRSGRVTVTLDAGPRPLVAELTEAELEKVRAVLTGAVEAARRDDYSRIRLREALRAAIGRDPFTTAPRDDSRGGQPFFSPWLGVIFVFSGVGFAVRNTDWLRLAGIVFALIALGDVVRHGVRHVRQRRAG